MATLTSGGTHFSIFCGENLDCTKNFMLARNKYRRTLSFHQPMRQHLWAKANQHTGFCKHFICKETLSRSDSPTCDQDISRIKYTRCANFTKLCRHHRETSTTSDYTSNYIRAVLDEKFSSVFSAVTKVKNWCLFTKNDVYLQI